MTTTLRPTTDVWIAALWRPLPLVFHLRDRSDWGEEVEVTVEGNTGVVRRSAFTICGVQTYYLKWDPDWSPTSGRFVTSTQRGAEIPYRLLNLANVRPCTRCFR